MALGRMGDPFGLFAAEILHDRDAGDAGGVDAFSLFAETLGADALAAPTAPATLQVHDPSALAAHFGMNTEPLPPGHCSAFTVGPNGGYALQVGPNGVRGAAWGPGPLPSVVLQRQITQQNTQQSPQIAQIVPRRRGVP